LAGLEALRCAVASIGADRNRCREGPQSAAAAFNHNCGEPLPLQ
jgi:hypothetical protein